MSAQLSPVSPSFPATASGGHPSFQPGAGLVPLLWAAFRLWRVQSRMRNVAADMDPRIMQDVGVPEWLVHETTVHRELARLRNVDYLRW
ncbi:MULTISPECIES: isoleucyl-tRNA synthetase [Achromobacter]|uniref:isoleucyl-tRNA synthetase n=1 Tax=Achromobacter TaxID=222 RepID=UPI001CB89D9E|nr:MULTISPECIES: isoleucyl-tRNA synthetase [Achromobacter]